jgi:uncharacterized protein
MNCPSCNVTLAMMERQGIEIDYCPQCRGVWLDRGELDKIIERSVGTVNPPTAPDPYQHQPDPYQHQPDPYRKDDDRYKYDKRYKKKESFLSDLFDFD